VANKRKHIFIGVRCDPKLRNEVRRRAKAEGLTVSGYIKRLLKLELAWPAQDGQAQDAQGRSSNAATT
jgi:hypothetical protein